KESLNSYAVEVAIFSCKQVGNLYILKGFKVSEYSLAPEHPLHVIYDDSWTALQWVTAHVLENPGLKKEPWLIDHADFRKIFVGGDSAGGNIAHNVILRAGVEGLNGGVKILGGILSFPYFQRKQGR
ncbi:hydrolase 3-like, partial [Nicotiana sylvestris]|uniref:2-hydroxyisoflavanone dehydratase-like n=1 Tax=Nicotiana sylvestris TaxID=4096 RepID=A0A1U7YSF9_NICSY